MCKRRETDRAGRAHDRENMERDHEREVRLERQRQRELRDMETAMV